MAESTGGSGRRTGRSIWALFAGFLVVVVSSTAADLLMHATGIFPPMGEPMSAYRFVFAVIGCYLTARLAPARPMKHALIGGAIGLVLAMIGAVATWNSGPAFGPHWYPLSLVVTAIPCAWIGGRLFLATAVPR
jgi:peptidoglycan/LPS O-acetylase OafA/YrhL